MNEQTYYFAETDWGMHVTNTENCLEDFDTVHADLKAITLMCAEKGISRILCESRKNKTMMSLLDLYETAMNLSKWCPAGMRIAYLMPHFVDTEDTVFFETAAKNRAVTIKFFASKEKAIAWLVDRDS